ncbi:hypothetical protein ES703_34733 [subsurface metagenome]
MVTELRVRCSKCGAATDWDTELGEQPLCVDCWDDRAGVGNQVAAYQRRYYQEHQDQAAAYQRRYRQEHQDQVAARQRRYYQEHQYQVAFT